HLLPRIYAVRELERAHAARAHQRPAVCTRVQSSTISCRSNKRSPFGNSLDVVAWNDRARRSLLSISSTKIPPGLRFSRSLRLGGATGVGDVAKLLSPVVVLPSTAPAGIPAPP